MEALSIISIVASITSILLAGFTIWLAKSTERDTRKNFDRTNDTLRNQYEKTKDVLAEIDKRASVTEKTVTDTQEKMVDTITNLLNETFLPKKQDPKEVYTGLLLSQMLKDPSGFTGFIESMTPLIEKMQGLKTRESGSSSEE